MTAWGATVPRVPLFIYYLLDGSGVPLYIGRSSKVAQRVKQHHREASKPDHPVYGSKSTWLFDVRSVHVVGPMPWNKAVAFEREQIDTYQPRGNIKGTRRDPSRVPA